MTVLFTALVGFLFFGEKIGTRRSLALLAGFAGVVVLASSKIAGASIGWAVVAGATASFLYGIGINLRSEEHTSDLQSLMRNSYAVFCLKKKKNNTLRRELEILL